jgi:hypothetical protein
MPTKTQNLAERIEADLRDEAEKIIASTVRFAADYQVNTYEHKMCMETLEDQKRVIARLINRLEETKREHQREELNTRIAAMTGRANSRIARPVSIKSMRSIGSITSTSQPVS